MPQPTAESKPPVHPHEAELKNPDGSWKYTNSLINETSPYLLQHAHNPVDWMPWGQKAFDTARRTGKPIFLSIGYSTCYWCHVMERQVFENPKLAALANEHFVCIKVDREERPDVDDLYMAATQMMTGHGGWPMSVFLTPPGAAGPDDPGLQPFWAGTYIPPEPKQGMPGFAQIVQGLSTAWRMQQEQVIEQAQRVTDGVSEHLSRRDRDVALRPELIQAAANQLAQMFDTKHGGFGQAPKFPQPNNLLFLIKIYRNNPNEALWREIARTLEHMARGGMYDQVGGGFHRYSTDEKWLVPHFEKMLYDNAQLLEVYLIAHETRPDPADPDLYARVARETCEYVLREMTEPDDQPTAGVFWSAQDAEVDAREGLNYLWTPAQVRDAIVDRALASLAQSLYGLDRGTNFQDPHHGDEPPRNVLYLPRRLDELANSQETTLTRLADQRREINRLLLAIRDQRKQPGTDDKTIVAWNGMMIAGFARAGRVLDEPRYTAAAERAATVILDHMWVQPDANAPRQLLRTMRRGEAKIPAFLEDYAYLTHGLLELARASEPDESTGWIDTAKQLMSEADQLFSAQADRGGGYYDTRADQPDLLVRTIATYDGAIPSANSQMAHNLITLSELTGDRAYLDRAVNDLRAFAGAMTRNGAGMAHMHHALLRALESAPKQDFQPAGGAATDQSAETDTTIFDMKHPGPPAAGDVTVSATTFRVDPSGAFAAGTVAIVIPDGYHLNGPSGAQQGLIPTAIKAEAAADGVRTIRVEARYPDAIEKVFPYADQPLRVYEERVEIPVVLRWSNDPDPQRDADAASTVPDAAVLLVTYQACSDTACLAPSTVRLSVRIEPNP